ncbi:hypothetical protein AYM40_07125 [Paraburkholderia phytofirmans OLGA172]|uniref:HTH araC/xylS-type domain-containing protein n=1 Tax=Paraburkholderia phytofirmans OLGA172 TaxID=1417228 RepID=A0A160FIU5_9BURK|nr:AraC family transcriptional regulator [Paraburkholderia phytofirmans]ANB72162.1 hypothetical protein AYM40_07125 [Paraburkholderia phytofirmans OLGA172]
MEMVGSGFFVVAMVTSPPIWSDECPDGLTIVIPANGADGVIVCELPSRERDQCRITGRNVSILAPGHPYSIAWHKETAVTTFSLSRSLCDEVREGLGGGKVLISSHPDAVDPIVWHLGRKAHAALAAPTRSITTYLQSLAFVMCHHVVATYGQAGRPSSRIGALPCFKLKQASDYIDEHISEPISFRDVAAALHISPFHFSRMFKLATGSTPQRYITERRVDAARVRLAEDNASIACIAYELGFQSQSHFTAVFRQHVGVTPKEYRVQH